MDTPGYDPVSVTGIVAGGANLVCFTTGRGSVFGSKPAPSLKLTTTTELYRRMPDDMDFNCGAVLGRRDRASTSSAHSCSKRSSRSPPAGRPRARSSDFGDEEFAPWQLGAVM